MCYGLEAVYGPAIAAMMSSGAAAGGTAAGTGAALGAGAAAAGTGAALGAGATAGMTAAEIAAMEAAAAAAAEGGGGLLAGAATEKAGEGLMGAAYNAMVPGTGSAQSAMLAEQTGAFGLDGLAKTMQAASGAQGLSPMQAAMGNYGGSALANLSAGGKAGAGPMAAQMGMQMMQPPQQQPMPMSPPRQQGPMEPLPNPYGQGLLNSMDGPPPGMTMEAWMELKRRKRGLLGGM